MQQYPGMNQERVYMPQYQNQYGQPVQNNPYASQTQAMPRRTSDLRQMVGKQRID